MCPRATSPSTHPISRPLLHVSPMLNLHSTFSQLQNTSTRQYGPLQHLRGSSATLFLLSRLSCTQSCHRETAPASFRVPSTTRTHAPADEHRYSLAIVQGTVVVVSVPCCPSRTAQLGEVVASPLHAHRPPTANLRIFFTSSSACSLINSRGSTGLDAKFWHKVPLSSVSMRKTSRSKSTQIFLSYSSR